jgi:hypothetical protein
VKNGAQKDKKVIKSQAKVFKSQVIASKWQTKAKLKTSKDKQMVSSRQTKSNKGKQMILNLLLIIGELYTMLK